MTTENQPVDPRINYYIPENWIQPTGGGSSGSGSYINFPTAQTANILFPGAILCSNLKSFAPSAPMNLYNDSTSGNIEIANNYGYTGGIVINSNATAPTANTIRIGDTDRTVIMPKTQQREINGIDAAGLIVNADLTVTNGFELYTNEIRPITAATVSLPNGATTTAPSVPDNTTRVPTTAWVTTVVNNALSSLTGYATYAGTTAFTALQTFNANIKTNVINVLVSASDTLAIGNLGFAGFTLGPGGNHGQNYSIARNCFGSVYIQDTAPNPAQLYLGSKNGSTVVTSGFNIQSVLSMNLDSNQQVWNFLGTNTNGRSAITTCINRISTTATGYQNVFNIKNPGDGTTLSQFCELWIQGASVNNVNYVLKASFIITNQGGAMSIASGTYSTDKQYSSSGIQVATQFNQPTTTRIVVTALAPDSAGGQYFMATFLSYPTKSSGGEFAFRIDNGVGTG